MLLTVLKSKIHRVKVTQADLNYIGSITIDEDLMDGANLIEGEQVHVFNYTNGERLITYVIKGVICMNGPAALKVSEGDYVIVVAYAQMNAEEAKQFKPSILFPAEGNRLI
jgi:aspartate 1-decarboxylase